MPSIIAEWIRRAFPFSADGGRILMLGLDASGRTTFLYKMKLGEIVTTIPTIGFNVETLEFPHKRLGKIAITAWDVGGCDKIRPLWRHYFVNTDAIVFFIDSGDRDRIAEARDELMRIMNEDELRGAALLVLANKQDLREHRPDLMTVEEVTEKLGLRDIKSHHWVCLPTSGSEGTGCQEAMNWLAEAIHAQRTGGRLPSAPAPPSTAAAGSSTQVASAGALGGVGADADTRPPGAPDMEQLLSAWLSVEDEPDDEFLRKLEDFTLDTWDHRTHLRIAWLYLTRHGRREGMSRIFASLSAFIANSPRTARANGRTTFHATLTYTWAHLVHYAMVATPNPDGSFKAFLVLTPQLCNGGLFLHYYTKTHIMNNPEARTSVVLPDKRPLPSLVTDVSKLGGKDAEQIRAQVLAAAPPPPPLSDAGFLHAVVTKTVPSWSHESELRTIWACLRLRGGAEGGALASDVLRTFQGTGFHATITAYWVHMLRGLMLQHWPAAAATLDAAAGAAADATAAKQAVSTREACAEAASLAADVAAALKLCAPPTAGHNAVAPTADSVSSIAAGRVASAQPGAGITAGDAEAREGGDDWTVVESVQATAQTAAAFEPAAAEREQAQRINDGSPATGMAVEKQQVTNQDPEAAARQALLARLVSVHPPTSAAVPDWAELSGAKGYRGEVVRKWMLDQTQYLKHYSKACVYSPAAAQKVVLPDKKALSLKP